MADPILVVESLWKRLCSRLDRAVPYTVSDIIRDILGKQSLLELRPGEFWALRDVSFTIQPGQVLGVIGNNGAGKSTLINLVTGIIKPTAGVIKLQTPRIAMIDINGGLNPIESGRENAATLLSLYGVPTSELPSEIQATEEFAGIGDFINAPVSTYSLGMRLRLAFSIYTRLKPDLFIIDEALGGGDQRFRNRFRNFLRDYVDAGGAILLCSHEMTLIQAFCDSCILLNQGQMMAAGEPTEVITTYLEHIAEDDAQKKRHDHSATKPIEDKVCHIKSITLKPDNNTAVRSGGPLSIEIEISVSETINHVACAIDIGIGELISITTLTYGYPQGSLSLQPPSSTICCQIDRLPLAPGHYDLRVSIFSPQTASTLATLGWEDPAYSMKVVTEDMNWAIIMRQKQNFVRVDAGWELMMNQFVPD